MLRSFYVFDLQGSLRKDLSETCRFTAENDPKRLRKTGLASLPFTGCKPLVRLT